MYMVARDIEDKAEPDKNDYKNNNLTKLDLSILIDNKNVHYVTLAHEKHIYKNDWVQDS